MIVLRQKAYSFKDRLNSILDFTFGGAALSMVFALPIAAVAKISGGSFSKAFWTVTLAGAILGGLLGNSVYSVEKAVKEYNDWLKEHMEGLLKIVRKNIPPHIDKLKKFSVEAENLNAYYDYCGYNIIVAIKEEDLAKALGTIFYVGKKEIPEDNPIPIMKISSDMDFDSGQHILWYSKKTGWLHDEKKISGPKEFVLDCIENKIDMFEVEDERWFPEYKKEFLALVKKYLW
jgi:hypothetical protein